MSAPVAAADAASFDDREFQIAPSPAFAVRVFGWSMLLLMAAFLLNVVLTFWFDFPGIGPLLGWSTAADASQVTMILQAAIYPAAIGLAVLLVISTGDVSLRADSERLNALNSFFIRACFWAVFLVGMADAALSWMRVENMLADYFNAEWVEVIDRSQLRGPWIHGPAMLIGILIALVTRGVSVVWLSLLVVMAELFIVFSRFIFSYEQAFMADLVRFWYAALFLFASAYTLREGGHVRVDVLYAGMSERSRGTVNAWGSVLLGMSLCWTVLLLGMWTKNAIIVAPLLVYETTQAGFGMYVKYMMAGFLGVFAVSMMIQFVAYLFEGWADRRGERGHRPDHHNEEPL